METNEEYFSTRDLSLAATFITLGFDWIGTDYQIEGERRLPVGYFKFKNSKDLTEAHQKYGSGQIQVEPRTFASNMRTLKAEVTNTYKNPSVNHSKFKSVDK